MKYIFYLIILSSPALFDISLASAQTPYKLTWDKDSYIVGAGVASILTGYLSYRSASAPNPDEVNQLQRSSVNWLDRSATYKYSESADKASDLLIGFATAAPFFLLTDKKIKNDGYTILLMYAELWSFIGGTSMISKGAIWRYRPYVYNPEAPADKKIIPDARMSFFSNHTAAAFASAVFISKVYGDYNPHSNARPYIWAGSLAVASVVGYLRYESGMHFPTDIFAGAAIGSFLGYIIPRMHQNHSDGISAIPYSPNSDYGFSIQLSF